MIQKPMRNSASLITQGTQHFHSSYIHIALKTTHYFQPQHGAVQPSR